jgi:Flp pilus assembly protein TadD
MKCSVLIAIAFLVSGLAYGQTADEYFNRAFDKANLEDDRGAIDDYSKAIELNPNDADAYVNRGLGKARLEDYRGAIADFTKAIKLNPNVAVAYYNRGVAKEILGQKDEGCMDYRKAGELGYYQAYDVIKEYCN